MVGAVEQKLRPACNGAEFAYPEPLMVYRIMVKHVVTLKLARVVNEVVVYSKVLRLLGFTVIRWFDRITLEPDDRITVSS